MSPRERQAAVRLALLAGLLGTLFTVAALTGGLSSERISDELDGLGWVGPLVFIGVSAALTVALVPGPLLAGAAGLLFGTAVGTPTAIAAATLGASCAFAISRRFGAGPVDELSGHRVRVVQDWIAARGFLAVLYARILPLMPFTVVNYAAGLTRVRIAVFALATAIGCAPRAFAYVALGGSLGDLGSPEALIAFGVLVAMALGGLVMASRDVRARRALTRSGSAAGSSSRDGRSEGRP